MRNRLFITIVLCFACNIALSTGQVYALFSTILNIPPDPNITEELQFIDSDTQLNLFDGGSIAERFSAGSRNGTSMNVEMNIFGGSVSNFFVAINSTVNISGGDVGFGMGIGNSTLNMSGGWIKDFDADDNSVINISGGLVGSFDSRDGTRVKITGGTIGDHNAVFSGSVVDISGGQVGTTTAAGGIINVASGAFVEALTGESTSLINITGGNIGYLLRTYSTLNVSGGALGGQFVTETGSQASISGGEFRLNGVLINGLDSPGNTVLLNVPAGAILSGTLSDGTPFAFSSLDTDSIANGTLTLKATTLPPISPTTITINNAQAPLGVRAGETLVVQSGGILAPNFNAGRGSTLQIHGGQVGSNLEAVAANVSISGGAIGESFDAFSGSTVLISGGVVGNNFHAFDQSVVNISGGSVGSNFRAFSGSTINVSGGTVGRGLTADNKSTINISGGSITTDFVANTGSLINISGGTISNLSARSGSTLNITGGTFVGVLSASGGSLTTISGGNAPTIIGASASSEINVLGTKFVLDGIDITASLSAGQPYLVTQRDVPFSGLLADGSPFTISLLGFSRTGPSFSPNASLKLVLVPEPASWFLVILLTLVVQAPIRRKRY
jgi:hypothetical protein